MNIPFLVPLFVDQETAPPLFLGCALILDSHTLLTADHVLREDKEGPYHRLLQTVQAGVPRKFLVEGRVEADEDLDLAIVRLEHGLEDAEVAVFHRAVSFAPGLSERPDDLRAITYRNGREIHQIRFGNTTLVADNDQGVVEVQLEGGSREGSSGCAVMGRLNGVDAVVGLMQVGGEGAPASRFLSTAAIQRFLRKHQLDPVLAGAADAGSAAAGQQGGEGEDSLEQFLAKYPTLARTFKDLADHPDFAGLMRGVTALVRNKFRMGVPEDIYSRRLRHSNRVLEFVEAIAHHSESPGLMPNLEDSAYAYCATLLHNAGVAPSMDQYPSDYLERVRGLFGHLDDLRDELQEDLDPADRSRVETVCFLAAEMYRDSPYWNLAKKHQPAWLAGYQAWKSANHMTQKGTIARVLRLAHAMDVTQSILPSLVHHFFERYQYVDGLQAYYNKTFLRGVKFLFPETPRLEGNVLVIPCRRLGKKFTRNRAGTSDEAPREMLEAILFFERIIEEEFNSIAKAIQQEDPNHRRNFHIRAGIKRSIVEEKSPLESEAWAHVCWALFVLATISPGSDSDASRAVSRLLPRLVEYLRERDYRDGGADDLARVSELLERLSNLRPNSQALQHVVEIAEDLLAACDSESRKLPEDFAEKLRAAYLPLLEEDPCRPFHERESEGRFHTFFTYGFSRLTMAWIMNEVAALPEEGVQVRPFYCVRRTVHPDWNDRHAQRMRLLAKRHEADRFRKEFGIQANRTFPQGTPEYERAHEAIRSERTDFASLPRFLHRHPERLQTTVTVIGARAFVRREEGWVIVGIYGSHLLSCLCRSLGVPFRVVTSEQRLHTPLVDYDHDAGGEGFQFSYALVDGEEQTETECIPIEEVDSISTEQREYSRDEILALLEQRLPEGQGELREKDVPSVAPRGVAQAPKTPRAPVENPPTREDTGP